MGMQHVMVVDPSGHLAKRVEQAMNGGRVQVAALGSAQPAFTELDEREVDALVIDQVDGGTAFTEVCRRAHEKQPDLPIIIVTDGKDADAAMAAVRASAYDVVARPHDVEALGSAIRRALRHSALSRELKRLRKQSAHADGVARLLGDSPAMREVKSLVARVAHSDVSVMITGESGTGKELVARALHDLSERRGSFVPINCAAVPEQLLESELFGHVRGAFTDAKSAHPGLFLEADGGTLFLDEIGELPNEMQPKLLRAIEERKVRPVGGTSEREFDARVVAATNRDIDSDVAEGRFRDDLFYRLNVVRIDVPPLRNRGNDVLRLAQHFLERAAESSGKKVNGMLSEVAEKLAAYPFPGNVRELQNAIERAVALARYDRLTVDDLPPRVREHTPTRLVLSGDDHDDLPTLEEVERRYIQRVLEATDGNKTRAAKILGCDRRTLYRKLKRLGIVT